MGERFFMRFDIKRIFFLFLIVLLSISIVACSGPGLLLEDESQDIDLEKDIFEEDSSQVEDIFLDDLEEDLVVDLLDEDGYYTSKEDVALYLNNYDKLPNNFIRKGEASDLGWESNKANLWDVTDRMSIGGDKFGNREGLLPKKDGRQYYECDINYEGGYRGAERLVFSNDGLIYYTADHYDSFELLYGEE